MAVSHVNRKLSRHEVEKKTLLMADANMEPIEGLPGGDALVKTPEGKVYEAELHDTYTDNKFFTSLKFANDDFYYKEGLSRGRRMKLQVNSAEKEDDKLVIHVELYTAEK